MLGMCCRSTGAEIELLCDRGAMHAKGIERLEKYAGMTIRELVEEELITEKRCSSLAFLLQLG